MGAPKNDRKRSRAEAEPASLDLEDRDNGAVQSTKKARVEERRSLFIRSLPATATTESLTEYFSQHYPVKHAIVVADQKTKESRGYGFVTFADAEDAQAAKDALHNKEWEGRRLRIDLAERRQRDAAKATGGLPATPKFQKPEFEKPPKLIIRNLPWSIKKSEQLTELFRSFGKVRYADLPQTNGKLKGFGFVTLRGKKNAERALEVLNGKEIDGRTLAVDWAVDKATWDKQQPQKEDAADEEAEEDEEEDDEDADEDEDEDVDEDDDASMADEGAAETTRDSQLDADLENFMKSHMQNLEDEDEDDENEEEEEEQKKPAAPKKLMTDNSATVFIRNLPFTATDEQVKGFFAHFGTVRYARVVMDKATEKPAGTAFVCFFDAEDAKECIKGAPRAQQQFTQAKNSILQDESADPDGKYTLDGRLLSVAQAVNKEQATTLADSSLAKRNLKDKRRLFLLSEGAIDSGSPLFQLLTPMEIQMRKASAKQRKKMVETNPSLHLSLTRLALRNIPRHYGSKEMKELARKAVVEFATDVRQGRREALSKEENARDGKDAKEKDRERKQKGKGIVRQAKVVYESAQGTKMQEKNGSGRSRGYGFIEYTSHHWALMGLRYLNGLELENEAGRKQRLVVEFAIENVQVVQRRRANEERSRQMQGRQAGDAAQQDGDDAAKPAQAAGKFKGKDKGRDKGKGKDRGKPQKPKGRNADKGAAEVEAAVQSSKPVDPKEDMKQKLIQRKRLMRKKKATSRGTK